MLHLIFAPIVVIAILIAIVMRILTAPFRMGRYSHRHMWRGRRWGWDGYRNPYGPGLMTILAIVALERLFGGRRYY